MSKPHVRTLCTLALIALASEIAVADPTEARVISAPTAWLPPAGAITGSGHIDQKGDGSILLGYGFGGLAAIELGTDTDVRTCTACSEDVIAQSRWFGRAAFRLGARQDAWFKGMPALMLGVRNTFATPGFGAFQKPRVTEAYVVASRVVGPVRMHGGAAVTAAIFGDEDMKPQVRPLAGFEFIVPSAPKSSFMLDAAWSTRLELEPEPSEKRGPALELVGGFGARYQAFRWASIELDVRVPQTEGFAGSRVLIRVNGVWEVATPGKKRLELR